MKGFIFLIQAIGLCILKAQLLDIDETEMIHLETDVLEKSFIEVTDSDLFDLP